MAPETVASSSPESTHIRAEGSSHVTSIRMALPRSAWELLVAVLLALSILVNVYAIFELRTVRTQLWLNDYDLGQLKSGPLADLKSQAKVNNQLIEAYGLGKQCKR